MCRIYFICAEYTSRSDHADRHFAGFHLMYLCGACLCTQQQIAVDIEGILFVLCRMICRNIQCFKVVIISFYFRTFDYFISHTDENTFYFVQHVEVWMYMTNLCLLGRQCNVDRFLLHLCFSDEFFHFFPGVFQHLFNLGSCFIDKLSDLWSVFRCHILHTLQDLC